MHSTKIITTQHIRSGKVIRQEHRAILTMLGANIELEAPTLPALQRKVEAAGGRFARNEIETVRLFADPDFY